MLSSWGRTVGAGVRQAWREQHWVGAMTERTAPGVGSDLAKSYEPTPEERTAIAAHFAQKKQKPPAPRIKLTEKAGTCELSGDHPNQPFGMTLVMQALGTDDGDFFDGLMAQLVNASTLGKKPDDRALSFMLAAIKAIQPKDEAECMLAAQMAAVHMATMTFARRLAHVDNIPQQDSAERAFNKLARTFAVQMEALKRYRTGGEQRVTVQHVTVNEGGRAIVGAVSASAARPGGAGNQGGNPMKGTLAMHRSPRCIATSKRTKPSCQAPAVTGWAVCRFHGARGGGPKGTRNGAYKDGLHTAEAVRERRAVSSLLRRARAGERGLADA